MKRYYVTEKQLNDAIKNTNELNDMTREDLERIIRIENILADIKEQVLIRVKV